MRGQAAWMEEWRDGMNEMAGSMDGGIERWRD
jgi:hypothetical protein